jgi:septal ring factor EnvC (AmiA/AmiB activator)
MPELALNKNNFWLEVKKHFISVLIGAVCIGVPFYFKSMATDEKQTVDISELQTAYKDVSGNISDIKMKLSVSSTEPANTKEQIQDLKQDVKKISDRQDKMYDLLLQVAQQNK